MNAAPDAVDQPNAEVAFAGTKNIIPVTLLLVESFAEYGCVLFLGLRVYPHGKGEAVVPLKVRLGAQIQEVRSIKCQALAMLARYQDRRLQLITRPVLAAAALPTLLVVTRLLSPSSGK